MKKKKEELKKGISSQILLKISNKTPAISMIHHKDSVSEVLNYIYNNIGLKYEKVKVKDTVKADQPLTLDPNVGGFGQEETELVLQNPNRVKGMIVFFFTVTVAQILLVIKKKQFEKVQAAEMNF